MDSYTLKKGKKVETEKGEVKTTVREIDSGGRKISSNQKKNRMTNL